MVKMPDDAIDVMLEIERVKDPPLSRGVEGPPKGADVEE